MDIKDIMERFDQQQAYIDDLKLTVADLQDRIPLSEGEMIAQFHRHRFILEALLVEQFGLESSEVFYIQKKGKGSPYVRRMPSTGTNIVEKAPERAALILLFYIMSQHNHYATRRRLRDIYGYSAGRNHEHLLRIEASRSGRKHRESVERRFLDAIGRPSEPVTTVEVASLFRAACFKQKSTHLGITYLRSATDEYINVATGSHFDR